MNAAIDQYLSLGFVPDAHWAERYLARVFGGSIDSREADPADLLTEILEGSLRSSAVVIPLSGGLDSRGVLGAALRLLPPKSITCLTIAQPDDMEWQIASAICWRNGLSHERIDPNEFIWDLDELVEIAKAHASKGEGLPTIDTLFIYVQLAKRIGTENPVLSGYFGDAISGKHLRATSAVDEPDTAARRFINNNTAARNGCRIDSLRKMLVRFIASNERWLGEFCGLTRYDLLDFGFRQAQRVRVSVTSPYLNCVRPYEDPRWVRFWLRRSLTDRLDQHFYREALRSGFPEVFGVEGEDSRTGLRGMSVARGDPRINASLRETLCRAAESFDNRNILPIKFLPNAIRYVASGSRAASLRARIVLSTEVHLRAGLL